MAELTLRECLLAEAIEDSHELETKALKVRIKELEAALKPFAAIQPSTFFSEDGSEAEGYSVQLPSSTLKMKPDFTGRDLAFARKVLKT